MSNSTTASAPASGRIKSQNKPSFYVHFAITLLLMFGLRFTPHPALITDTGWQVIGVFLGVIYGWNFLDSIPVSILGIIAIGMTDYISMDSAILNGFGNNIVMMIFIACTFIAIVSKSGVCELIADRMLNMKIMKTHPWLAVFVFFFVNQVLGAFTSNSAILLLFWAVFADVCTAKNIKKGKFTTYIMAGLCFTALAATISFFFKAAQFLGLYQSLTGETLDPLRVSIFFWILNEIMLILYVLVGKYVLRIDAAPFAGASISLVENKHMTPYQKLCLGSMFVFLFLMFVPSFLPSSWWFTQVVAKLGNGGVCLLCLVFFFFGKFEGAPRPGKILSESAPWNIYFMLACVMVVANAVRNEELGIVAWIEQFFAPIFTGHGSLFFIAMILIIPLFLTNFFNNIATGFIFIPLAVTFAPQLGVSYAALSACLCFSCSMGLFTPAAGYFGALFFSKPDWLSVKDCRFYGVICFLISGVTLLIAGYPLASLLL